MTREYICRQGFCGRCFLWKSYPFKIHSANHLHCRSVKTVYFQPFLTRFSPIQCSKQHRYKHPAVARYQSFHNFSFVCLRLILEVKPGLRANVQTVKHKFKQFNAHFNLKCCEQRRRNQKLERKDLKAPKTRQKYTTFWGIVE